MCFILQYMDACMENTEKTLDSDLHEDHSNR
jgi:hypothetical protein